MDPPNKTPVYAGLGSLSHLFFVEVASNKYAKTPIPRNADCIPDMNAFAWEIQKDVPSTAVVEAVCAVTGTDPFEAPPLEESVDPEHLNDLIEGTGDPTVTFIYDGHVVEVEKDAVRVVD